MPNLYLNIFVRNKSFGIISIIIYTDNSSKNVNIHNYFLKNIC